MKKYLFSLTLSLFLVSCMVQGQAAILITGFGSSDTNPFNTATYPSGDLLGNWGGTASQTATTMSITSASNDSNSNGIYSDLTLFSRSAVNITGNTGTLRLTGTLNSATPGTDQFSITLYDASFNSLTYRFAWSAFNGGATVTSNLYASSGVFNGTVSAWGLDLFGPGGDPPTTVSFTFDSLLASAVPEPSTYALLGLGLGLLALGAYRRKMAVRA